MSQHHALQRRQCMGGVRPGPYRVAERYVAHSFCGFPVSTETRVLWRATVWRVGVPGAVRQRFGGNVPVMLLPPSRGRTSPDSPRGGSKGRRPGQNDRSSFRRKPQSFPGSRPRRNGGGSRSPFILVIAVGRVGDNHLSRHPSKARCCYVAVVRKEVSLSPSFNFLRLESTSQDQGCPVTRSVFDPILAVATAR